MAKKYWLFVALFFVVHSLCARFHPGIKWQEINSEKFVVIFPAQYEKEARYTLFAAKQIYQKLSDLWQQTIAGKIRILLIDSFDEANGYATFFPFNLIGIYLYSATPDTAMGNYRDWIFLVLGHEMSHIFNLNCSSGYSRFMRGIFGSHPVFYPMVFSPSWMIEGLAIMGESALDPGGRFFSSDFDYLMRGIRTAPRKNSLKHVFPRSTRWPGPAGIYVYGATFLDFLGKKFGKIKVAEFVHYYAGYPLTFRPGNRFQEFFGQPLDDLWGECLDQMRTADTSASRIATPLTDNGMVKHFPRLLGDGRILFAYSDFRNYSGFYRLDPELDRCEKLVSFAGINGVDPGPITDKLYFSATDIHRSYYYFSDLYVLDIRNGHIKRLSRGNRLFFPAKSDDRVYCVQRKGAKAYLAAFELHSESVTHLSGPHDAMAYVALSPDQQHIAVSVKNGDDPWKIVIFRTDGSVCRVLSAGQTKQYYPVWKNMQELFFVSEVNGKHCLTSFSLETDTYRLFSDPAIPFIRHFHLNDSDQVIFTFYDSTGMNLARIDLKTTRATESYPIEKTPVSRDTETETPRRGDSPVRRYNFLRDLLPKYFSPSLRYAGNEIQVGALFSGLDATERQSFHVESYYGWRSETFNVSVHYQNDSLYPTIQAIYTDFTNLYETETRQPYFHKRERFEIRWLLPVWMRNRQRMHIYADIHSEHIQDRFENGEDIFRIQLNGFGAGCLFSSAKTYVDSISPADGIHLTFSMAAELTGLGSDFNSYSGRFEVRYYQSLARPNTLAFRFVLTHSWGEAKRLIYMGGAEARANAVLDTSGSLAIMRAYPSGFFTGTGGFLMNIEYRIGLFQIQTSTLLSAAFERIYLTVFTDFGNVWVGTIFFKPSISAGAELSLDVWVGTSITLSCGGALGFRPQHGPLLYARIGKSF